MNYKNKKGFTLIEMIGVLAVIGLLAAVLVPRVFEAIEKGKVMSTAESLASVKTACTEFAAKYGYLPVVADPVKSNFASLLRHVGILRDPFKVPMGRQTTTDEMNAAKETWTEQPNTRLWQTAGGTGIEYMTRLQVVEGAKGAAAPTCAAGAASTTWLLNLGDVAGTQMATNLEGKHIVYAVIPGVPVAQARELSLVLDGEAMSEKDLSTGDTKGRVMYSTPAAGLVEVHVFIADM